jgi:hypothetical protein
MESADWGEIGKARIAAIEILRHNAHGPFDALPRTAGWGYPEPYTRDLMISILGIAATGDLELIATIRRVLETLANKQTLHGHIASLVHDNDDRGASDTTPLFLLGVGIFRKLTGEKDFLEGAVIKSLKWMETKAPTTGGMNSGYWAMAYM